MPGTFLSSPSRCPASTRQHQNRPPPLDHRRKIRANRGPPSPLLDPLRTTMIKFSRSTATDNFFLHICTVLALAIRLLAPASVRHSTSPFATTASLRWYFVQMPTVTTCSHPLQQIQSGNRRQEKGRQHAGLTTLLLQSESCSATPLLLLIAFLFPAYYRITFFGMITVEHHLNAYN